MESPSSVKYRPLKLAALWVVFCATCLQMAFQKPYVVMVPGERTNLFSALLCLMTLICVAAYGRKQHFPFISPAFWLSGAMVSLGLLSSAFSLAKATSFMRLFSLLAPALGGYWTARILLATPPARRFFRCLSTVILLFVLWVCVASYFLTGRIDSLLDVNSHALVNLVFLLSFAPLSLLGRTWRPASVLGFLLLCTGLLVVYWSDRRIAILIPLGFCLLAGMTRFLSRRACLILLLVLLGLGAHLLHRQSASSLQKDALRTFYRIESYPFSLHIARKHPFLGCGLLAPRDSFLADYQMHYPFVSKEVFEVSTGWIKTSENIFLTFMADLGFPFLLLYSFCLLMLLGQPAMEAFAGRTGHVLHEQSAAPLLKAWLPPTSKAPSQQSFIAPLALLPPLAAAIVHYNVFDGLLYPQLCWYFHLLLGLIPHRSREGIRTNPVPPNEPCSRGSCDS